MQLLATKPKSRKTPLAVLSVLFIPLIMQNAQIVQAQTDTPFTTNYDVMYQVSSAGETQVSQDIEIINNKKDVIAKSYTVTVRQMQLENITAFDEEDSLDVEVIEDAQETRINAKFNDVAIGKDKSTKLAIQYKSSEIATKIGSIWTINIPKVSLLEATQTYNVNLLVPKELGPEIYVSPTPTEKIEGDTNMTYSFTKDSLDKSGITAAFGEFQTLNFELIYTLENESNFSTMQQVLLPPDIKGAQQIAYDTFEPMPEQLQTDKSENIIATFRLEPKKQTKVKITGTVRMLVSQIRPDFGGEYTKIPSNISRGYTKPDIENIAWFASKQELDQISDRIMDPTRSVAHNAQAAYTFVVNNLKYSTQEAENSNEPVVAVENAKQFVDVFIALARTMKIPARQIEGYAIGGLTDSLAQEDFKPHTWAEFYDPEFGWVSIDPAWGSSSGLDFFSKLDTNHIAFEIGKPRFKNPVGSREVKVTLVESADKDNFVPYLKLYKSSGLDVVKLIQGQRKYSLKNVGKITVYMEEKTIIPQSYTNIYLPKDNTKVTVKDAAGKTYEMELRVIDELLKAPMIQAVLYVALELGAVIVVWIGLAKLKSGLKKQKRRSIKEYWTALATKLKR